FSDPGPVFHTIVSIKNDGHYFCRAGGNRPDGLNEPVTKEEKMPMFQLGIDVSKNNLDLCLLRGTLKGRSKLVS
ncbi:hypothetical protein ACE4PR_004677, partial [Escherichia coli]